MRIFRFSAFGFGFRQNTNQFSNLVFDVVFVYPLWVPVARRSKRGQLCASTDLEYPQNLCVPLLHQLDWGFDNWDVEIYRFCLWFSVLIEFFSGLAVLDDGDVLFDHSTSDIPQ